MPHILSMLALWSLLALSVLAASPQQHAVPTRDEVPYLIDLTPSIPRTQPLVLSTSQAPIAPSLIDTEVTQVQPTTSTMSPRHTSKARREDISTEARMGAIAATSIPGPGLGPGGNQRSSSAPTAPAPPTEIDTPHGPSRGTKSSTMATSSSSNPTPSNPLPYLCWTSDGCKTTIDKFASCRKPLGPIDNPNNLIVESKRYQECLCSADYQEYVLYISNLIRATDECAVYCNNISILHRHPF